VHFVLVCCPVFSRTSNVAQYTAVQPNCADVQLRIYSLTLNF